MTKLERALKIVRRELGSTGRPWALVYKQTHTEADVPNVGIAYGGDMIYARGLFRTADDIISELIKYTVLSETEENEDNDNSDDMV